MRLTLSRLYGLVTLVRFSIRERNAERMFGERPVRTEYASKSVATRLRIARDSKAYKIITRIIPQLYGKCRYPQVDPFYAIHSKQYATVMRRGIP